MTYEGAIVEGSFQITPAKEVRLLRILPIDKSNGQEAEVGQEVLEIDHSFDTGREGQVWKFRARADRPVKYLAFVRFWTDLGEVCTHISLEVKGGPPPGGRVLFCESPFGAYTDHWTHANLNLVTRELQVQTNSTDTLPADLSPFHTVILRAGGLRSLVQGERKEIDRYLESGGRLIVLANHFFRDTVMLANHVTEPYGIRILDREYYEVLCGSQQIVEQRETLGVRRLRWFRPSPIITKGEARLLVRHPDTPGEGFVACGGPRQNLFAIGDSLLHGLVCVGWPFDNGQLLANLLMQA